MNVLQYFTNLKQSFGDNVLPVRLVPAQRNRSWCQCVWARKNPLTILLLVVIIPSASLNFLLLTKYGIKIEERENDFDKHKYSVDDAMKPEEMVKRNQGIQFVDVILNEEFKRIQSLAKEIPEAALDAAAMRDIVTVYNPQKYTPLDKRAGYRNKNFDGKHEIKEKDRAQGEDFSEEDEEKHKIMEIENEDEENLAQRVKQWNRRKPVPSELQQVAPDIFKMVPRDFTSGLKNPCWRRRDETGWTLLCLPYFFLLGMPKCGTSDLWYRILQHPQVTSLVKEPHWWTRSRIGVRLEKIPFTDYLKLPEALYSEIQQGHNNVIYGDGSASTMWDNRGWQNFFPNASEPPFVVADIIREILPDAKLIIILRDPVERLYSDYLFGGQSPYPSAEDFHHRVLKSIKSYEECRNRRSLRYCIYDFFSEKDEVRLRVGFYSLYLREWVRLYPIDQIAILELTQWSNYCTDILPQLYQFLEIGALKKGKIQEICKLPRINDNSRIRNSVGDMLPETRRILKDLYGPLNADLAKMLGNDIFEWL